MKKKVVFLTGAGMSVESGFKTFRGNDGLWENYPVEQVASHEGWEADPTLVNNFYNMMRRKLWNAQPNEGHRLVAELENTFDVSVLTQNVDDLHERAGSSHVIHLHGELTKVCSSRDPYDERYIQQLTPETNDVKPGALAGDGSLLRPSSCSSVRACPCSTPQHAKRPRPTCSSSSAHRSMCTPPPAWCVTPRPTAPSSSSTPTP